jgi:gamma-glutamyltranspeptidase/glutathione hydrolase
MPWRSLLQPAIALAAEGFAPDDEDIMNFATELPHLQRHDEIRRVFLSDGFPAPGWLDPAGGVPIRQPDLAATIGEIAEHGPDTFYHGAIGHRIGDYIQERGGVLSANDLERFEPDVGEGLRGTYRGFEVVTSSALTGGLTLIEMLNLAEHLNLGSLDRWSGQCLHLLAEIMRQSWTDRFVYVGDSEGIAVPIDALTSKRYAASLLAGLSRQRVPDRSRPGDPWPHSMVRRPSDVEPSGDPGGTDTTHLAVADGDGNLVTLTQTLGLAFGSCIVVPTTGVLLNDVTMWMNPEPGTANSVGPWKRQLGHATPVVLLVDGRPFVALGAPGGRRAVTAIFQVIVNIVDFGMDIQDAIGAPRIHCEGAYPARPIGPTSRALHVDDRVPSEVLADLTSRGHEIHLAHETSTQNLLAKPLGIQFGDGTLLGGVDVFRRSVGIGI